MGYRELATAFASGGEPTFLGFAPWPPDETAQRRSIIVSIALGAALSVV